MCCVFGPPATRLRPETPVGAVDSTLSRVTVFPAEVRDLAFFRLFVLDIRSTYFPGPQAPALLDCFFSVSLKGMTKRRRARMQALLLSLAYFSIDRLLYIILLVLARDRHVRINLCGGGIFDHMGNWTEALEERIALEIIIQQHTAQIEMAGVANTVHI